MKVGHGSYALLAEMTLGLGRRGLAIALGGSGLAAACAPIQPPAATVPAAPTSAAAMDAVNYFQVATEFVNSYVLVRGDEIAIVDTGLPGNLPKFEEAITGAGLDWGAVAHLILTHYHGDHVGGMGDIMAVATNATIYAGAEDVSQIEAAQTIQSVVDGDEVFGLQIVGTPGHTAGHISVLDPAGSLIVLGDAMTNQGGQLGSSPAQYTWDMNEATATVKKLAALQFDRAVFGHGEPIESGASAAIADFAATLE